MHRALKWHYAGAADELEARRHGYVIDVARADALVEIQTANFAAIKRKLRDLTARQPVLLVYPIPQTKWLLRQDANGQPLGRRKSPRRGRLEDCFAELARFPALLARPNLALELLLIELEECRRADGMGSWRRQFQSVRGRRLLRIVGRRRLASPADCAALLPRDLPPVFTTRQLAAAAGLQRRLAGQMAYCLREMGALRVIGRKGRAYHYARVEGGLDADAGANGRSNSRPTARSISSSVDSSRPPRQSASA